MSKVTLNENTPLKNNINTAMAMQSLINNDVEFLSCVFEAESTFNADNSTHYLSYFATVRCQSTIGTFEVIVDFDGRVPETDEIFINEVSVSFDDDIPNNLLTFVCVISKFNDFKFEPDEEFKIEILPQYTMSYSKAIELGMVFKNYSNKDIPESFKGYIEYRVWGKSSNILIFVKSIDDGRSYRFTAFSSGDSTYKIKSGLCIRTGVQEGVLYTFSTKKTSNNNTLLLSMKTENAIPLSVKSVETLDTLIGQ